MNAANATRANRQLSLFKIRFSSNPQTAAGVQRAVVPAALLGRCDDGFSYSWDRLSTPATDPLDIFTRTLGAISMVTTSSASPVITP